MLTAAVLDGPGRYQRTRGMSTLPTWAILPIAAAVMLLSPVFGFLVAIGVEILIGILKGTGLLTLLAAPAIGIIG